MLWVPPVLRCEVDNGRGALNFLRAPPEDDRTPRFDFNGRALLEVPAADMPRRFVVRPAPPAAAREEGLRLWDNPTRNFAAAAAAALAATGLVGAVLVGVEDSSSPPRFALPPSPSLGPPNRPKHPAKVAGDPTASDCDLPSSVCDNVDATPSDWLGGASGEPVSLYPNTCCDDRSCAAAEDPRLRRRCRWDRAGLEDCDRLRCEERCRPREDDLAAASRGGAAFAGASSSTVDAATVTAASSLPLPVAEASPHRTVGAFPLSAARQRLAVLACGAGALSGADAANTPSRASAGVGVAASTPATWPRGRDDPLRWLGVAAMPAAALRPRFSLRRSRDAGVLRA